MKAKTYRTFLLAAILGLSALACDYTGYDQMAPDIDQDEAASETSDNSGPKVTGSGTCGDPYVHGTRGRVSPLTGTGSFAGNGSVSGESCYETAKKFRVADGDAELAEAEQDEDAATTDGDLDSPAELDAPAELEPVAEAEEESMIPADLDIAAEQDVAAELEPDTMDQPTEIPAETETVTEVEAELEEEAGPSQNLGLGPEVTVKVELEKGEILNIKLEGTGFDGIVYVLLDSCSEQASCVGLTVYDTAPADTAENVTFVAPEKGTYVVVMDTKAANTGSYSYALEIKAPACKPEDANPPQAGFVGAACEMDSDCSAKMAKCLNQDFLTLMFGPDSGIQLPGGYCSGLGPSSCTEDVEGLLIKAGFMGKNYELYSICLRPCLKDCDCRTDADQVCLDPMTWSDKGYLDSATVEKFFKGNKICLTRTFITAIEKEMTATK